MASKQVHRYHTGDMVEGDIQVAQTQYEFRGVVHSDDDTNNPSISVVVHKYRMKPTDGDQAPRAWREWMAGNPAWVRRHRLGLVAAADNDQEGIKQRGKVLVAVFGPSHQELEVRPAPEQELDPELAPEVPEEDPRQAAAAGAVGEDGKAKKKKKTKEKGRR
ncbi:hypothetical protein MAPG_08740 [Magnaporthiopsis poae ATCC 64411]|uniref:Uncharacterized protein n=1 Tax=Magnaporthiopsis poae (strain ATCC 64411 / 73-15) TaxID=644358 RepID=A0A0C4E852_MAGP6|nr:hypothetical protein MAPG_08740 [Magnaporthiopsis poae ATCC 64411]